MDKKATKKRINSLSMETVRSVYSGKPNKCCCGCSGIHRRNSAFGKENDYDVINDNFVRRVIRLFQMHTEGAGIIEGGELVSMVLGGRLYIAYTGE